PFHARGVAATGSNQTLAIVGLIHGNCMQQGLSMFLCPAHIVSCFAACQSRAVWCRENGQTMLFHK
ncbi:MAG: hypothetical protein UDY71_07645, partial [Slackia isoflavoniconvertens]|nr:hypothetical protein [Slackia isoflavoniconvertens]